MEESGAKEKRYNTQDASVMTEESGSVGLDHYVPEQRPSTVQGSWKPYGCDKCGKRFTLKGSLKTHEKLHGFRPTYTCDVCGKSFKVASGLKAHAALHAGAKPFKCEVCDKTFTLKGSLKTHSAIHSTDREAFPCYICGKMYKGKASLMSHTALHLGKRPDMCESQSSSREAQPASPSRDTPLPLNMKTTEMPSQQAVTLDFWHRFPQLFHGYDIPEGVAASQPVVARECTKKEICSLNCDSPTLGMLGPNHSDDMTFYIGQSLVHKFGKSKPPLSQRTKPFSCETCGKRFTLRGSLKTHEKLHSFRETYHCNICGKSFKVEGGLKSHAVLHTNHRPFMCVVCGKGFTLKGSLKTHLALHSVHRATFPCDICGKTYKGKASFDSHKAQHLGQPLYQCEICGKNFTLKGSLKLHSMLHSGVKPYTCQACGMGFAIRSHLTRHFRMHTLR